jgi:hypothetical protein
LDPESFYQKIKQVVQICEGFVGHQESFDKRRICLGRSN